MSRRRWHAIARWFYYTFTKEGRKAIRERRVWIARIDDSMMRGDDGLTLLDGDE